MRPIAGLLLATTMAVACTMVAGGADEFLPPDAPPVVITPEDVARGHIDAEAVRRHVRFLASDARRGRATPSQGLERSAAWIVGHFHDAGLEPAGDSSGYLQYWPLERAGGSAGDSTVLVPNVVGVLRGSDTTRADEYVVIVAHYDHVGVGTPDESGDSIYNGADDNASGVAALVEIARAFGALPDPPARPILFLAVSGEERGLLGSEWFTAHPTRPLDAAVATLNMDMVGRNHPDTIAVIGYDYSALGPLLGDVAASAPSIGLHVTGDPYPGQNLFRRSDHYPFALAGIPAVAVSSGLHDDYHRPSDEARKVDADKVARVARLVFLTAHRLATMAGSPEWTEEGERRLINSAGRLPPGSRELDD